MLEAVLSGFGARSSELHRGCPTDFSGLCAVTVGAADNVAALTRCSQGKFEAGYRDSSAANCGPHDRDKRNAQCPAPTERHTLTEDL